MSRHGRIALCLAALLAASCMAPPRTDRKVPAKSIQSVLWEE